MKIDEQNEQDDLWRVLGNARTPVVSPFFSRNVLRAIREEKQEKKGMLSRLLHPAAIRWGLLSASACVLLVVTGIAFHPPHPSPPSSEVVAQLAQQVSASPDYQVINHLDELIASEQTSVWLDK